MKKAYYYLFYKLYKFSEAAPSRWWSEWKASLVIDVLIYFILLSIGGYYTIATKKEMIPVSSPKFIIFIVVMAVASFNYFVFNYQDKWKSYVLEFDHWPKKKNNIGGTVVWLVVILIFVNLIYMFSLLSQIDWKQYR